MGTSAVATLTPCSIDLRFAVGVDTRISILPGGSLSLYPMPHLAVNPGLKLQVQV